MRVVIEVNGCEALLAGEGVGTVTRRAGEGMIIAAGQASATGKGIAGEAGGTECVRVAVAC